MPDFFDVLRTRRTVRSFTSEPVGDRDLQELVDLAVLAPTGMGLQPWAFTIVTDRAAMGRLNAIVLTILRGPEMQPILKEEGIREIVNDPGYDIFYGAPALIAISGDTKSTSAMIDCQLAAENLFLAAHAKGLGTCYMGFLVVARARPEVREILRIPAGHELMAASVVGRPAALPDGPPKRDRPRVAWVR